MAHEMYLQDYLNEYNKELDGQPRNEADWLNRVRLDAHEPDSPLRGLTAAQRDEAAVRIFRNLDILDVENADTSTKARDVKRTNNRRYVNGTF